MLIHRAQTVQLTVLRHLADRLELRNQRTGRLFILLGQGEQIHAQTEALQHGDMSAIREGGDSPVYIVWNGRNAAIAGLGQEQLGIALENAQVVQRVGVVAGVYHVGAGGHTQVNAPAASCTVFQPHMGELFLNAAE